MTPKAAIVAGALILVLGLGVYFYLQATRLGDPPEFATGNGMSNDDIIAGLSGNAYQAATEFVAAGGVLLSGYRDIQTQCDAMAKDVAQAGSTWIQNTYAKWPDGKLRSPAAQALQDWCTANPSETDPAVISAAFVDILNGLSPDEVATLSRHLEGQAFDAVVNPALLSTQQQITAKYGGRFLSKEGGLPRYHSEFDQ